MNEAPDYDPIRKSWRENQTFNVAWMKNGERLTWVQRVGFAIVSLCFFAFGLFLQRLHLDRCEREICFHWGAQVLLWESWQVFFC
jgi:hypothetical protein